MIPVTPWESERIARIASTLAGLYVVAIRDDQDFETGYQLVLEVIEYGHAVDAQIFAEATYEIIRLTEIGSSSATSFLCHIADAQVEKVQGYR